MNLEKVSLKKYYIVHINFLVKLVELKKLFYIDLNIY